jgi:predicted ribosome quality control (RQC) complex YloA/Tae2 family protein
MRKEGIPVSLERRASGGGARDRERGKPPRLEGVRLVTSSDGLEILVGKTARDNDRLTFRLAGPEDFWLHAQGFPGAHVVVRSGSAKHLPERTLREAAALAAWYSDARAQGAVEVHWTRRKNVRRARKAGAGTVTLKRFETVRVKPASEDEIRPDPRKDGGGERKDGRASY